MADNSISGASFGREPDRFAEACEYGLGWFVIEPFDDIG
jgi:hypothetical protein